MLKAKLNQGPIRVAGAMSGTSLDGVDVAVLVTDGQGFEVEDKTAFRPYSADEQAVLRAALGRWTGPEVAKPVNTSLGNEASNRGWRESEGKTYAAFCDVLFPTVRLISLVLFGAFLRFRELFQASLDALELKGEAGMTM